MLPLTWFDFSPPVVRDLFIGILTNSLLDVQEKSIMFVQQNKQTIIISIFHPSYYFTLLLLNLSSSFIMKTQLCLIIKYTTVTELTVTCCKFQRMKRVPVVIPFHYVMAKTETVGALYGFYFRLYTFVFKIHQVPYSHIQKYTIINYKTVLFIV